MTPILSLVVTIGLAFGMCFFLLDTWDGIRSSSPDSTGLMLAFRLIMFAAIAPILVVLGIAAIRSTWFYLYSYRYTDSTLDAHDPVLGKKWSICFNEVSVVHTFIVFGQSLPGPSRIGHLLETKNGQGIKLSEALSIWPEIASRCTGVTFEARPMPWWEVRGR